jgi:hypothetical protein
MRPFARVLRCGSMVTDPLLKVVVLA